MRSLILYVHEFQKEIGHTRAMLETLKAIPEDEWGHLKIVAFNCGSLDELFEEQNEKVSFHKVPFEFLTPFLSRVVFFHIYTFLWSLLYKRKDDHEISIGVAYLFPDIVNVQFVHHHWGPLYFQRERISGLKKLYKKILFFYLNCCEKWVYRGETRFSSLSLFVSTYLKEKFEIQNDRIKTIYSSVSWPEFEYKGITKQELIVELLPSYPCLKSLNPLEDIFLFVGAFQRKGLSIALKELSKSGGGQFIAIGKEEAGESIQIPDNIKFIHISFTKKLSEFYFLADHFIFPTFYEPFGLVIMEAYAAGCQISTTRRYVGASELLSDCEGVDLYNDPEKFQVRKVGKRTREERLLLVEKRKTQLKEISWDKAGQNFISLLNS